MLTLRELADAYSRNETDNYTSKAFPHIFVVVSLVEGSTNDRRAGHKKNPGGVHSLLESEHERREIRVPAFTFLIRRHHKVSHHATAHASRS